MGMRKPYIKYINKCADIIGGLYEKNMLELGDQVIKGRRKIKERTGKEYYTNLGVNHTSIDLNGRHGSLKHDLSKPIINPNWINNFDIITNLGTTEHVEPLDGQYQCFRNIHNFLSVGGIIIHVQYDMLLRKEAGLYKKHANHYYKDSFYKMLADECNYELIDFTKKDYNQYVCLKKNQDNEFMKDKSLFLSHLINDTGGRIWKGING